MKQKIVVETFNTFFFAKSEVAKNYICLWVK